MIWAAERCSMEKRRAGGDSRPHGRLIPSTETVTHGYPVVQLRQWSLRPANIPQDGDWAELRSPDR